MTPRLRIAGYVQRVGGDVVARRCAALLGGALDEDPELLVVLGGEPARRLLAAGIPPTQAYWLRVWAARGLLWLGTASDPGALGALRSGLRDDAWRVREMTCRVVARHRIDELLDEVAVLEDDASARVRRAAQRALVRVVGGPHPPGPAGPAQPPILR